MYVQSCYSNDVCPPLLEEILIWQLPDLQDLLLRPCKERTLKLQSRHFLHVSLWVASF